jgi:hypothetical protein
MKARLCVGVMDGEEAARCDSCRGAQEPEVRSDVAVGAGSQRCEDLLSPHLNRSSARLFHPKMDQLFHDCLYLLAAAKAVAAIRTMLGCRVPSFGIWPYGACGGTEK